MAMGVRGRATRTFAGPKPMATPFVAPSGFHPCSAGSTQPSSIISQLKCPAGSHRAQASVLSTKSWAEKGSVQMRWSLEQQKTQKHHDMLMGRGVASQQLTSRYLLLVSDCVNAMPGAIFQPLGCVHGFIF